MTPAALELRAAVIADAPAIARLHAESWRRTYRGILSDAYLDGPVEADRARLWADRLAGREAPMVSLLEQAGRVTAFICVFLDRDPEWGALLENLHVAPVAKGRGLGRALLAEGAAHVARSRPGSRLHLWVYEGNDAACRFYERLGASLTARAAETAPDGGEVQALRYGWDDPSELARVAAMGAAETGSSETVERTR